ncbi:hypothetical protein BH23ACT9_BH23ACT9_37740 [soil metagenome]
MPLLPLSPERQVTVLRSVAALGLAAALLMGLAGWVLLGQTQRVLVDSLRLTGDTLAALDASAGVASDTVDALSISLSALEQTSVDLDAAFADGETLMRELAGLVRTDVADTLEAVEGALPGIVDVAGTIDRTLSALSVLPFGPSYDPSQSFAASLNDVSQAIEGVPDRLREQADAIDATAGSLGQVGEGVSDLAGQVAGFEDTLASTSALLSTYDDTLDEGAELVAETSERLAGRLWLGRVAIVLFVAAFAAMQIVPLHIAALAAIRLEQRERDATSRVHNSWE